MFQSEKINWNAEIEAWDDQYAVEIVLENRQEWVLNTDALFYIKYCINV